MKKIIIILLLMSLILVTVAITSYSNNPVEFKEIKVKRGQTLWNIATDYSNCDSDPRKLVYQIKKVNNIEDSLIQPGQILKIPVNDKS